MKKAFFTSFALLAAALVWVHAEESTVKLSKVHLCCESCVKGVDKALTSVNGAKAVSDKDAGTIVLTASDKATLQKAVNALTTAGYFGTSSDSSIKVNSDTGAKAGKMASAEVTGVHLCCKKCVTAVDKVVKATAGTTENTAAPKAESFKVSGDFSGQELMSGLQKEGLTGRIK